MAYRISVSFGFTVVVSVSCVDVLTTQRVITILLGIYKAMAMASKITSKFVCVKMGLGAKFFCKSRTMLSKFA